MRRVATILGAAILLSTISCPAHAAKVIAASGSYEANEDVYFSRWRDDPYEDLLVLPNGKYRIALDTSTSISLFEGSFAAKVTWINTSCLIDGVGPYDCSYNDWVDFYPLYQDATNQYSTVVKVIANRIVHYPDDCAPGSSQCITEIFDVIDEYCCGANFAFISERAGTYTLSATAIPEPSAWMMMLTGFGAVGASIRARRRLLPNINPARA